MTDTAAPPHAHSWVWAVLTPEHRRVCVLGDPGLSATLHEAGLDVSDDLDSGGPAPDAVLVGGASRTPAVIRSVARLREAEIVAVAVGGGREALPDRMPRWLRALELGLSPLHSAGAAVRAARTAGLLGGDGREVQRIATGERARRYGLGPRSWRWRHRLPVGWVLVGWSGPRRPSVAERTIAEAASRLGAPLSWSAAGVVETGKLMIELVDDVGRAYMLRVAAGAARPPLEQALRSLAALGSADLPPSLRDRIAWPLVDGEVGRVRYALEAKARGRHPARMTSTLWHDCLEFLVALRRVSPGIVHGADPGATALADHVRAVASNLDNGGRAALGRIERELHNRLGGVPLGWSHGDFTRDNLFVEAGRLRSVVDWEWAAPNALPLLDLLELTGQWDRRAKELPRGRRLTDMLLPFARAGGDERVRRYCAVTGTPADPRTLAGLAVAQWLTRMARELAPPLDPSRTSAWVAENLQMPLAALDRGAW
jgi:aminoglycoside phosphotransferase (APT) family kinase protein